MPLKSYSKNLTGTGGGGGGGGYYNPLPVGRGLRFKRFHWF